MFEKKKWSHRSVSIATTLAVAGSIAMATASPASAAGMWGPYTDRGSCQADRTQAMYDYGASAGPCSYFAAQGAWYFTLWN